MENENKNPRNQLIDRLKQGNNVLVTVSKNPSVDQLSAAIGLTLLLNALDKHATAVFSGTVPNTLEFLKPEETLEKNTDSLRDFIISLDKSKADKLRYKVEDTMVKIFITPYKTSLSEADLVYEQGDFNVDVIVAIGVHQKEDLDDAITNHGRILHDATISTVNTSDTGQLGSINWVEANASSVCEMLASIADVLKPNTLDAQMATAFLTGIVAETQRFSNEKTSSDTMNLSAKLMAAGANQQLVATKLEQPAEFPMPSIPGSAAQTNSDGSLDIKHSDAANGESQEEKPADLPDLQPDHEPEPEAEISKQDEENNQDKPPSRLVLDPPALGGKLTANTEPEGLDPSTDPLTLNRSDDAPMLSHDDSKDDVTPLADTQPAVEIEDTPFSLPPLPGSAPSNVAPLINTEPTSPVDPPAQTLTDLETAVDSSRVAQDDTVAREPNTLDTPPSQDAAAALAAAHEAFDASETDALPKPADFNASAPMEVPHGVPVATMPSQPAEDASPAAVAIDPNTGEMSYPSNLVPPSNELPADPTAATVTDPTAPPPVPPPFTPPPMPPPNPQ